MKGKLVSVWIPIVVCLALLEAARPVLVSVGLSSGERGLVDWPILMLVLAIVTRGSTTWIALGCRWVAVFLLVGVPVSILLAHHAGPAVSRAWLVVGWWVLFLCILLIWVAVGARRLERRGRRDETSIPSVGPAPEPPVVVENQERPGASAQRVLLESVMGLGWAAIVATEVQVSIARGFFTPTAYVLIVAGALNFAALGILQFRRHRARR